MPTIEDMIQQKKIIGDMKVKFENNVEAMKKFITHFKKLIDEFESDINSVNLEQPSAPHAVATVIVTDPHADYVPPCYYCVSHVSNCPCSYTSPITYPPRELGTKLKWLSSASGMYRVAIVTKNGVLQVKSVTDGTHDTVRTMSKYNYPCHVLKKTFFPDEASWRASLPDEGTITVGN
jgi:hypothetical protein